MPEPTIQEQDTIREAVRQRYAAAATRVANSAASGTSVPGANSAASATSAATAESGLPILEQAACCGGDAPAGCESVTKDAMSTDLYARSEVADLPSAAVLASLGCGNPTALAELRPGEVVLDLGSGGGIDVLLSAKRVGPTGFAYGLDMTDEMLALAETNRRARGVDNVRFLKGQIEHIPLPDASVDVIISNCVINLSADKPSVLREAFRVLKPGGRFAVSDVVVQGELPAALRQSMELWAGCIAGALEETTYRRLLAEAGFEHVGVEVTRVYAPRDLAGSDCCASPAAQSGLVDLSTAGGRLVSAFVRATRPT
jgi:arsenite methyltransferase